MYGKHFYAIFYHEKRKVAMYGPAENPKTT